VASTAVFPVGGGAPMVLIDEGVALEHCGGQGREGARSLRWESQIDGKPRVDEAHREGEGGGEWR
jgi:hypothetical protein